MRKLSLLFSVLLLINYSSMSQSNYTGAGISLYFDGNSGSYADLGDVFNTLSFPFSFEAWINPETYSPDNSGIFSSDNDEVNDNGFWVELNPSGSLQIEFGNGIGSGSSSRRGYATEKSIPLGRWTHISLSCKSVTDINIYINGVLQTKIATDGTSTSTTLQHSSGIASIGKAATALNQAMFKGQIDEIKLWKKSRSQVNIRSYMCKKIDPSTVNLIGYWNFDESYSSITVNDLAGPQENGTLVGGTTKLTSGAPVGDDSISKYTTNWFEVEVVLYAPSGEKLKTQDISGAGIHVYRVDAYPNSTEGLSLTPQYYFGVFCVEGAGPSGYNFRYKYSTSLGIVTVDNENSVSFFSRLDATQNTWTDLDGSLDINKNWITKHDGQNLRGEYIISIPDDGKISQQVMSATPQVLKVYPNPAHDLIKIELTDQPDASFNLRILDESGRVMKAPESASGNLLSIDVSDMPSGIYLVEVTTSTQRLVERFVVER